jgi:hypothetical protein
VKFGAVPAAVLLVVAAQAAENSAERAQAFARLPDWRGYWNTELMHRSSGPSGRPEDPSLAGMQKMMRLLAHPPYNQEWERRYQQKLQAGSQKALTGKVCDWRMFPVIMEAPSTFQIVVLPEEVMMIFDKGAVRHIHTDGRQHPGADDIWSTRMGHSVGRWEQGTLVIDTVATAGGPVAAIGVAGELSDQARFVERLRMVDGNTLENRMTIEDPSRLTKPWELTISYHRARGLDRMIDWDCDEDLNPVVDGKLTVVSPK